MLDFSDPPFTRMYKSFALFSESACQYNGRFLAMSAGANWQHATRAVVDSLHWELEAQLTTRNYGRSNGPHPVTSLLELIEDEEAKATGLRVAITGGSADAASMIIEGLMDGGILKKRDRAMMIGHGFPLYSALSTRFGLRFCECLGAAGTNSFLPTAEDVVGMVDRLRPRVVFLLLPNNPFGEVFSPAALGAIIKKLEETGACLLVDRVCQMPWDNSAGIMTVLAPGILKGSTFVVDSFSKSESLAGLRTGYAVLNGDWVQRIGIMTQTRTLNPPVFSTITLAFTRLAEAPEKLLRAARKLILPRLENIFAEYPEADQPRDVLERFLDFRFRHLQETEARKAAIEANFQRLRLVMEEYAVRPLLLSGGFNVAVCLASMNAAREALDQHTLAVEHGTGVLPESCFRATPNTGPSYFLRIGLTLPEKDFADGVDRLAAYYRALPSLK